MNIKKNNHLIIPQTHNINKNVFNKTMFNNVLNNQIKNNILHLYKNPCIISANDILKLYNIDSSESLIDYIKDTIKDNAIIYYDSFKNIKYNSNSDNENEVPFGTLNKVFNSWIYENFTILQTHNGILNDLSYILLKLTIPHNFMSDELLKKNIKDYIEYWFAEKNINNFNFDLINDMNNYFNKKFKK
jgi:hypothetical protein